MRCVTNYTMGAAGNIEFMNAQGILRRGSLTRSLRSLYGGGGFTGIPFGSPKTLTLTLSCTFSEGP